jgi:hypothetical protein
MWPGERLLAPDAHDYPGHPFSARMLMPGIHPTTHFRRHRERQKAAIPVPALRQRAYASENKWLQNQQFARPFPIAALLRRPASVDAFFHRATQTPLYASSKCSYNHRIFNACERPST